MKKPRVSTAKVVVEVHRINNSAMVKARDMEESQV
jgi:hypothetical protein